MNAVVNTTCRCKPELLLDANGDPITTKVTGDWTKTARLLGTGTTATPTITHVANGIYDIAFTPTAVGNWSVEYSVTVDAEVVYFDPQLVQVETAQQADPVAYISAGDITMVSPVASTGVITIYQGDDYSNDDDRSLEWSTSDAGTWPDLTSATIALIATQQGTGTATLTADGSVVTPTGASKAIMVELTDTETSALSHGIYDYQVIATLASGNKVTLAESTMTVKERLA